MATSAKSKFKHPHCIICKPVERVTVHVADWSDGFQFPISDVGPGCRDDRIDGIRRSYRSLRSCRCGETGRESESPNAAVLYIEVQAHWFIDMSAAFDEQIAAQYWLGLKARALPPVG